MEAELDARLVGSRSKVYSKKGSLIFDLFSHGFSPQLIFHTVTTKTVDINGNT